MSVQRGGRKRSEGERNGGRKGGLKGGKKAVRKGERERRNGLNGIRYLLSCNALTQDRILQANKINYTDNLKIYGMENQIEMGMGRAGKGGNM